MAYEIAEAKRLVIEAGKRLLETGLIARTWGNVSARISDTQFVITPSGRSYENLTPDEIVVVNIEDCSYEGDVKPSSEKGIHADAYKHHPTVDFVIHTHQKAATIVSATGMEIRNVYKDFRDVLGDTIPVADYAMSTTPMLRKNVERAITMHPGCRAFLLMHHGTLCMGDTYEDAFKLAETLEACCERIIKDNYIRHSWDKTFSEDAMRNYYLKQKEAGTMPETICDLGSSVLHGKTYSLTVGGETLEIDLSTGLAIDGIAPKVSKIHTAIYKAQKCTMIRHLTQPDIVAVSCLGKTMYPMIDDFAQIAGISIRNCGWVDGETDECAKAIAKALDGRNAVLVDKMGALVTGNSEGDMEALSLVMEKGAATDIGANIFNRVHYVPTAECMIMRTVYVAKYSKQISK
ncbi:MAG: class II aldolase/adducin family protein [Clostridiales bacterium]|nr:class II aldolase/adducin family protein [Clostridiales bacterium]